MLPCVIVFSLPLETLPFWPAVEEPSALQLAGVILGIPILLCLAIALLVKVGDLGRAFRRGAPGGSAAFWVNPGSPLPAAVDAAEDDLPFTVGERESLIRAARRAEVASGLEFSVYVGPVPAGVSAEDHAIDLLDSLPDPERSVLVFCDPETKALEFVTGDEADRQLTTSDLAQAAAEVRSTDDGEGLLVVGLERAIDLLGEHARQPEVLHSDTEHRSLSAH